MHAVCFHAVVCVCCALYVCECMCVDHNSASKKKAVVEEDEGNDSDQYDDFGRKKKKFRAKGVKV